MLSNFPAIILAPNDIPARIISASDSYPYNIANKIVPERDWGNYPALLGWEKGPNCLFIARLYGDFLVDVIFESWHFWICK